MSERRDPAKDRAATELVDLPDATPEASSSVSRLEAFIPSINLITLGGAR